MSSEDRLQELAPLGQLDFLPSLDSVVDSTSTAAAAAAAAQQSMQNQAHPSANNRGRSSSSSSSSVQRNHNNHHNNNNHTQSSPAAPDAGSATSSSSSRASVAAAAASPQLAMAQVHLALTPEEVGVIIDTLMNWIKSLSSSDAAATRRFYWMWGWATAATENCSQRYPTLPWEDIRKRLETAQATVYSRTNVSAAEALEQASAVEDKFFDKTVQTLVHEHLPMGVFMIHLGPEGFSKDDDPLVNAMACEIFGYTRSEFTQILKSPRGWDAIYHASVCAPSFNRLVQALAGGLDSYVTNSIYVHKTGYTFEALESRKIIYGQDGVPTYLTVYIQRCDGPLTTMQAEA